MWRNSRTVFSSGAVMGGLVPLLPLFTPKLKPGTDPGVSLWAISVGAEVDLDRDVRERGDALQALAVGGRREGMVGNHREDRGMARTTHAPDVQVGDLGIAVALDGLADLGHQRRVHLAVEEHPGGI